MKTSIENSCYTSGKQNVLLEIVQTYTYSSYFLPILGDGKTKYGQVKGLGNIYWRRVTAGYMYRGSPLRGQ